MSISAGQEARADDFINNSEQDATPSNDNGRVAKLESVGDKERRIHHSFENSPVRAVVAAGTTFTAPAPVFQDKDDANDEWFETDASDVDFIKFDGVAITDGTDGNDFTVQMAGIVDGLSGLDPGGNVYVDDSRNFATSPGTNEILVGLALDSTRMVIQKGRRRASGTFNPSSTGATTQTIGFRPSAVWVHAVYAAGSGSESSTSHGGWTASDGNRCAFYAMSGSGHTVNTTGNAWNVVRNAGGSESNNNGNISNITDTSFDIDVSTAGTNVDTRLHWIAEGDR